MVFNLVYYLTDLLSFRKLFIFLIVFSQSLRVIVCICHVGDHILEGNNVEGLGGHNVIWVCVWLSVCVCIQEWWTHLWLNEGFASWIEYLCVDHCFPEYDIWTQFVSADYTRALDLDALDSSHPIEVSSGWIDVMKLKTAGSCSLLGRMFLLRQRVTMIMMTLRGCKVSLCTI